MRRYAVRVEYVGKNYAGSQIQMGHDKKSAPKTIQSELENALSTLIDGNSKNDEMLSEAAGNSVDNPIDDSCKTNTNKKRIKTVFSGRTDKGVNSRGQVVHFDTDKTLVASKFIYSMNAILPKDISLSYDFGLKEVANDFHAQKSAKRRSYQYVFYNKKQRSAFDSDFLLVRQELNIQRMQKALEYLLGEHDFRSFESSGSTAKSKVCFIYKVECKKLDDMVVIDIVGNRFLYNMVRAIIGTLLLFEQNNLPPETMNEILEARDRAKAGKTVSPYGLTLMKVEY